MQHAGEAKSDKGSYTTFTKTTRSGIWDPIGAQTNPWQRIEYQFDGRPDDRKPSAVFPRSITLGNAVQGTWPSSMGEDFVRGQFKCRLVNGAICISSIT